MSDAPKPAAVPSGDIALDDQIALMQQAGAALVALQTPEYLIAKATHATRWSAVVAALRAYPNGYTYQGTIYTLGQMPGGHETAIQSRKADQ